MKRLHILLICYLPFLAVMAVIHYKGAAFAFGNYPAWCAGAALATFMTGFLVVLGLVDRSRIRYLWWALAIVLIVSNTPNTQAFLIGGPYQGQVWGNAVLVTLCAAIGPAVTHYASELDWRI